VFVLTDGSGSQGRSRLESTTRVLERAGVTRGPIYGVLSDRQFYEALLAADAAPLLRVASTLFDAVMSDDVDLVASDAREGFNPAHDLCFHLAEAVVARARLDRRRVSHYAFALDAAPEPSAAHASDCIRITLSDEALARKIEAARGYVGLDGEVNDALSRYGAEAFRTEVLSPATSADQTDRDPPMYERFGEQRLATGIYERVIRRRHHVEPIVGALRAFASERV
jgi:hypothetical protein